MRVVVDTNVWVSGFLKPTNAPGQVLKAVHDGKIVAVSSPHLWAELQRALSYRSVRHALERDAVWSYVEQLLVRYPGVELVDDVAPSDHWVAGDPDDDWVIQCAITSAAAYIIFGDKAVQQLQQVAEIPIVSATRFVSDILAAIP